LPRTVTVRDRFCLNSPHGCGHRDDAAGWGCSATSTCREGMSAMMSHQMSSPELPNPGLLRQILATPLLTLVLMGSGLFLLAMMAFTVWGDRGLLAMWRTQRELERLVREIEIVEQKNATLSREVQRLRSDLSYIEKIAREELGLVRPGEIVFEFAD